MGYIFWLTITSSNTYLLRCRVTCRCHNDDTELTDVLWRYCLGGTKGIRPVKTEWWGAGVVICLEQVPDLHMAQLMPLPLTVSCFTKVHIGFTFLILAHLGSPGKRAVKWVVFFVSTVEPAYVYRTGT